MAKKSGAAARQSANNQGIDPAQTEKWLPWILAGITFFLFTLGFRNEMLSMDDHSATVNNPAVTNFELFTQYNLGMYAPVTWFVYAIAYALGGESSFWYHFFGALVHALNVVLVYRLFRQLGSSQTVSGFVAFFFAVHPLQVEPVAWIAGLSTPLSALFSLLAMQFYLKYTREDRMGNDYWYSIGMFVLACLAKSTAVVVPLTLFVLDMWNKRPLNRKTVVEKAPYFLLSLGFGILTLLSRQHAGQLDQPADFSIIDRLLMACETVVFYWTKLLFPVNLSIWYPFVKTDGMWPWTYYAAPVVLAAVIFLAWKYRTARPLLWIGLLFYLVNIVLSLPWATFGSFELRSDRYNYLASLGFFAILTAIPGYLEQKNASWATTARTVLGILGVLWMFAAAARIFVWKDTITLIENAMKSQGDNFGKAYLWRGTILADKGQGDPALRDFNKAINTNPLLYDVYKYRGNIMGLRKFYEQSVADLSKYIEQYPNAAPEIYNRGLSYVNLNNDSLAMIDFNRCLEIDSTFARAYRARGNTYLKWGQTEKGQADLQRYEDLKPK